MCWGFFSLPYLPQGLRQLVLSGQLGFAENSGCAGFTCLDIRHRYQGGLGGPLATPPTCGDAFGRRRVSAAC